MEPKRFMSVYLFFHIEKPQICGLLFVVVKGSLKYRL